MADRLTEIEELAIELAEERTLHQTTLARVRELETALERTERLAPYTVHAHKAGCAAWGSQGSRPCDCGLDAALAPAEER